jgi:hypothetical protein
MAAEPVRGYETVPGTARDPPDVQQLGPRERQQFGLRAREHDDAERWYVVDGLRTTLGDIDIVERDRFITGVKNGFVEFAYRGSHQELIHQRLTPEEVAWAGELLAGITRSRWLDAFRAGGYQPAGAARYMNRILDRIDEAGRMGLTDRRVTVLTPPWSRF